MGSEELPSRWDGIEDRIPRSLDELHGPAEGMLELPLHLCWSGMRVFDLGNYRHRRAAYHIVVVEAMRPRDVADFLDAEYLVEAWPDIRCFLHPRLRRTWESRFPQLRHDLTPTTASR